MIRILHGVARTCVLFAMYLFLMLMFLAAVGHAEPVRQTGSMLPYIPLEFFNASGLPNASGKVCSYAAGTTTPLSTYSDYGLTSANANPMALSAIGQTSGNVYLKPQRYKFVIHAAGVGNTCNGTAVGAVLRTIDNVGDVANLPTFDNIRLCDRFTGSTGGAKMIAAIADLPSTGGTVDCRGLEGAQSITANPFAGVTKPVALLLGCATYTSTAVITIPTYSRIEGFGCGYRRTVIKGAHTGIAVISFLGQNNAELKNIIIQGDSSTTPKTGVLLARSSAAPTDPAIQINIENVFIDGYFSKAGYYSIGAEDNLTTNLQIDLGGGGALYGFATANYDFLSIGGIQQNSNTHNKHTNLVVSHRYRVTNGAPMYIKLNQTEMLEFDSCYLQATNNAYVVLDMDTEATYNPSRGPVTFHNCGSEPSPENDPNVEAIKYGVRFTRSATAGPAVTARNVFFDDVYFEHVQNTPATSDGRRIYCPSSTGIVIDGFRFDSIWRTTFTSNVVRDFEFNTLKNFQFTTAGGTINVAGDLLNGVLTYEPASGSVIVSGTETNVAKLSLSDTSRFMKFAGTTVYTVATTGQTGTIAQIVDSSGTAVDDVQIGTPYTRLWAGKFGVGTALPTTLRFGVTGSLSGGTAGLQLKNVDGPQDWALMPGRASVSNSVFAIRDVTAGVDRFQFSTSGSLSLLTADAQIVFNTGNVFANLGTPANGAVTYCSDCTVANPCAGGGTGALAKRLNGAWTCN